MPQYIGNICAVSIALLACGLPLDARVVEADIDAIVHPITVSIVSSAIAQAEREHADALLIRLSTPGGLMDATRELVEEILSSPVPVITWTGPAGARAASAGFFLLEAGDIAAMAPGTNTGASHPVLMAGEMDAVMKQKLENDAAALMRSITTRRNRNTQAAEKTVRESVSYTDREALDQHLIDLIAPDPESLLKQLDGREITRFDGKKETLRFRDTAVDVYRLSLRQRVLSAIADPNIALILLVLGALGLYLEFTSPGLVAPGVAGAILVLLGLTALSMLPIDWLGASLIILAFLFFILEAKFATHGVLTAGGAIAMVLGALMLVDTDVPELRVHLATAFGIAIPFALITSFLFSIALRARRNKVVTGFEGMLGQLGVAMGELNPTGSVLVHGEYWKARASAPVPAGQAVRITGVDGLALNVEPVPLKGTPEPAPLKGMPEPPESKKNVPPQEAA